MAEEEVIVAAPATSPVSSDCKRKFEDLHSQPTESNTDGVETDAAAVAEDGENKRPRLDDDNQNDLGTTFVRNYFIFHSQESYYGYGYGYF